MADRLPPPFSGPMPSSFDGDQDFYNERPIRKVFRKLKEEPLVPLGVGLTVLAFVNAYRALRRGDSRQANRMFRARVAAQGFTVVAMVAGSMYYSRDREKTKELRKLKQERAAEEKRQKWIRELEVRDDEEKALKAKLEQRRQAKADREGQSGSESVHQSSRGILDKVDLWSQGDRTAEPASSRPVEATEDKKPKKENPKSSLGAISEAIGSGKKREAGMSKSTGEEESRR